MKTIGLIGGVSWESTVLYYKELNESARTIGGGLTSAKIVMSSLNYEQIVNLENQNRWDKVAEILCDSAVKLESAGASCLLLCCNTLHKVSEKIEESISIPFLHIADSAAKAAKKFELKRLALLGTQFTMEEDFYERRLDAQGFETLIPNKKDREKLDHIIYKELCVGKVSTESQFFLREISENLISQGAEGVILACTELGLLLKNSDLSVPVLDTTKLHSKIASEFSFEV